MAATQLVIFTALDANWGHPVEFKDGSNLDVRTLLPALTTDVLIHTWDLARAVGLDVVLDEDLCEVALAGAQAKEAALRESGMFAASVTVPVAADVQSRLLGFLGRDPDWQGS